MWIHSVIVEVKLHCSWYLLEVRQPRHQEQSALTHLSTGCWGYMCSSINSNETQSSLFIHWSWALTSNMKSPDEFPQESFGLGTGVEKEFQKLNPISNLLTWGKIKRAQCSQVQQGGEKRWILGSLAFCQQEATLPSCHIGDENRRQSHPWG